MSDDIVRGTGQRMEHWIEELEIAGVRQGDRNGAVRALRQMRVPGIWAEAIAAAFAAGPKVEAGKLADAIETEVKIGLPASMVWDRMTEADFAREWLGCAKLMVLEKGDRYPMKDGSNLKLTGIRPPTAMQFLFDDVDFLEPHEIHIDVVSDGPTRTRIHVQHGGVSKDPAARRMKDTWVARLQVLVDDLADLAD